MSTKRTHLTVFSLAMLITGAIDSIRNLPATALFGNQLIFFFAMAAILFLIPTALVSAELAATWTEQGGVYQWVKKAFGPKTAVLAIWLQWINTMVWYPTILSFIAGTAAFLINPALAQNKYYLVGVILAVFWGLTFLNLRGLKTSALFASVCTVLGMMIPMVLIIGLALFWVISGKPTQLHVTATNILPAWGQFNSWISLTAIMAGFLGIELASVHVNAIESPQRQFPKAMLFSVFLILITMILGALAIGMILPAQDIRLVDGVMQAMSAYFKVYHLSSFMPIFALLLLIGSLGGMVNWIISPAKGLLQAVQDGYLPQFFARENKNGVASRLLISQAVLVSLISVVFFAIPSVNGSYWFLTDLSTQLYMLMYLLLFASAFYLRYCYRERSGAFQIPGGLIGMGVVCALGVLGVVITLIVGFFPPAGIDVGGFTRYEMIFTSGIVVLCLPIFALYFYRQQSASLSSITEVTPET